MLGREHRAEGETRRRRRRRRPWLRARGPLAGGKGERGSRPSIAARGGPRAQATRRRPRGSQHRRVGTRCVGRACCLFPDVSNSRPEKSEHEQGTQEAPSDHEYDGQMDTIAYQRIKCSGCDRPGKYALQQNYTFYLSHGAGTPEFNPALQQLNGSFSNKTRHGYHVNFLHASASHHAVFFFFEVLTPCSWDATNQIPMTSIL